MESHFDDVLGWLAEDRAHAGDGKGGDHGTETNGSVPAN
jgi:hypothetical protein